MSAPPPSGADGSAWPALLIVLFFIWLGLQFRAPRRAVWARRVDALRPVGQMLIRDARAVLAPLIARWEARKWDD